MSRISEVEITGGLPSNAVSGKMSLMCPHDESEASRKHAWLQFVLLGILRGPISGKLSIPLDTAGQKKAVIDKASITSIAVTLS